MQYSTTVAILLAAGSNLANCIPLAARAATNTDATIKSASDEWSADTDKVSQFLQVATSLNSADLVSQAATAFANENNELVHKKVLDGFFLTVSDPNAGVQAADATLVTDGTFSTVVNGLQNLATNGASMSASEVASAILAINQDRCTFVLPAIDSYFAAAGAVLGNGFVDVAGRPDNCP